MIRIVVHIKQYVENIPIIELELTTYHNGSKQDTIITYDILATAICAIEELSMLCDGKFINCLPRGKADKNAKISAFMTIKFRDMQDLLKFEYQMKKMME